VILRKIKAVWEPISDGMRPKERAATVIITIILLLSLLISSAILLIGRSLP
jgi:hypothetical protein